MMYVRKHLYPPNWKELSRACKDAAGWRCQRCKVRHGARRKSKRTREWYRVWLHAAHVHLHDTLNPHPLLMSLCPRCHGRYDYRLRQRENVVTSERWKHQCRLSQRSQGGTYASTQEKAFNPV